MHSKGTTHLPISLPINIPGSLLEEILSDAVQLLGRAKRVERQLLHVGLDEPILRHDGEDAVNQALVAWPQRTAAPAAACRPQDII